MFNTLAQLRQAQTLQNRTNVVSVQQKVEQAPVPPPAPAPQPKRSSANPKLLPTGRGSNASLHPSKRVVNQMGSGFKSGVPTVSSHVAKLIDKYDTMDELNNKITLYRHAKNYKRRGFTHSSMLNVIQPPGTLAGVPSVKVSKEEVSTAQTSNASQAVGYSVPDMKTMFEAFMSAMNTSKQSVSPAVLDAGIPEGSKEGGVVPSVSNTPALPNVVASELTQVPDKVNAVLQEGNVAGPAGAKKSLFRR